MPQAMTEHSPGSLDQWLYFLTQRTVPNLHQIHFFIFCVNKGFRFMLVYSCLHYLLFKNEKGFCFLRSIFPPVSTIKQDRELGVVSFCWTEIPDQNMIMNLNILVAAIRSFKMLIDYTLDLTPPFSPCPNPSLKRKRRRRNCFKIPTCICTGPCCHCKNPSKFFLLHLGTNFLSFDWDLLAFSFSNLFLFSPPPPPPPSSDASFKKLTPAEAECEPCFATSKES